MRSDSHLNKQATPRHIVKPKKSLGQNFLVDKRVLYRIVSATGVSPCDTVVEIGAGRGELTRLLADRAARVIALEIDETLLTNLKDRFQNKQNIRFVSMDARDADLSEFLPEGQPYILAGNLPYYAASPIIRRFLGIGHKPHTMIVMVQKEVANNMVAVPGRMGLLSVAVQLYGKPKLMFSVPPRAFKPIPKVSSAVVRIDVYKTPLVAYESEDHFFKLVKAGFSSPRKQIHNSLKQGLGMLPGDVHAMLNTAGIDAMRRPGTLSMPEWCLLYGSFRKICLPEYAG